jgi:hypothetical protein
MISNWPPPSQLLRYKQLQRQSDWRLRASLFGVTRGQGDQTSTIYQLWNRATNMTSIKLRTASKIWRRRRKTSARQ